MKTLLKIKTFDGEEYYLCFLCYEKAYDEVIAEIMEEEEVQTEEKCTECGD